MQIRRHSSASRVLCAVAVCLLLASAPALAAPLNGDAPSSEAQAVQVRVSQPTPSITPAGRLRVAVEVTLTAPAEYLEVRLRLRQGAGRVIYQKTEVRAELPPGRHIVEYEHDLRPLGLQQGRYPIEVRVLATGSSATNVSSRLLVTEPGQSLPVAVVVVASGAPAVGTDGRFLVDPSSDTRLRDDIAFVTELARGRSVPLALVMPPVLAEQLGRASAGYETASGVVTSAQSETAQRYAGVLEGLRSALATGTLKLLDVPYAVPDLAMLEALDAEADLALHWTRSDEVNTAVLRSSASPRVAYVGPVLTEVALETAGDRDLSCVLVPSSAVESEDATAAPGCYSVVPSRPRVLVADEGAAEAVYGNAEKFYDALFDRVGEGPVVVMLEIGAKDRPAAAVQHALELIEDAAWLRLSDIESLARGGEDKFIALSGAESSADRAYRSEIGRGREAALAYLDATGPQDVDASAVLRAMLISESSLFAFDARRPATEPDGRLYARDALDFVATQFALIRLDAKDVTLSGTKGDVPLTLVNDTGKPLNLTLHARSSMVLPGSPEQHVAIQPTQNFLTIPIDLGNKLSDTLVVEVLAGDVKVTETTVRVQASYVDRLAIIGMVVLVLAGLLVFIRRRVVSADAGTIVSGRHHRE